MKVGFIGIGKLGQPCAEMIASKGHDVSGYDINSRSSNLISIHDNIKDTVIDRDIVFIAVPTPHDPAYDGREPTAHLSPKDFDYSIVKKVVNDVNKYMNKNQLLVLISTVLPGTVRREIVPLVSNTRFIYNPYLIAMGSVAWDMVNPEMVIIGTEDGLETGDAKHLVDFYKTIMENNPRYEIGTWDECECIKVFYNCYSSDTEVLTDSGWKLFSDAKEGDQVLSLNPEDMIPEWVIPDKWVSRKWAGEMIHFHSSKDDVLVTPKHNMFIGKQTTYRTPKDGKKWGYSWNLMAAEEVIERKSFVFQRSTEWHNESPEYITIAGVDIPTDLYVQFMAWYLSEGCTNDGRIHVSQDRHANLEKYEMIHDIMEELHYYYPGKNKLCESTSGFSILWKEFANELLDYGNSFEKYIPDNIKKLGKDHLRLFLDVYNMGDGSAQHTKRFNGTSSDDDKKYKYYATSSDRMAADLGELIIKVGRFPSYRKIQSDLSNKPCNLVYELLGKTSLYQKSSTVGLKFNKINYDDFVYCAMLPKNHIFLTRRNGKCTWQGNTFISAKIGIVNMIQDVAERQGNINVDVVTEALANSNKRITGPQYMKAGMGDGGGCHPRDNIALRYMSQELRLGYDLFDSIMNAREIQAKNLAKFLVNLAKEKNQSIVIHGKAYKPGVEYCDGSYSLLVGHYCSKLGVDPIYVDPFTNDVYNSNDPAVFLMAHSASTTYRYTNLSNLVSDSLYCIIPDKSTVVDPWRTYINEKCTVIHYGNTRQR